MLPALFARALVLTLAASLASGVAAAPAAKPTGWVIDTTGGTSASITSASGTMTLTLGCIAPELGMTIGWKGAKIDQKGDFTVTVGKTAFAMHPAKARNALLLSNLPGKGLGLDKPFLDALRTGDRLVLGGMAFVDVPPAELTFPLTGSGKALKAVSAACKAPAVAPSPAAKPGAALAAGESAVARPAIKTAPATSKPVAAAEGTLSEKDMKAFVGHPVTHNPGTVDRLIYVYNTNGTYDVNSAKGRVDGGKYTIKADGQLCWDRAGGITGCFEYYRKGDKLRVRNMTNGAEIGPASLG